MLSILFLRLVFTSDISINTSNIRRRSNVLIISSICSNKTGTNDQHVKASSYVACIYAYVASENQRSLYRLTKGARVACLNIIPRDTQRITLISLS